MLAVHLENGRITTRDLPVPVRPPQFALLRLLMGGICNTDLELQRGYYDFTGTPGHEFVAEVVECDTPALRGKRVVGEINLACGKCEWCLLGRTGRHCPHRTVLGIVNQPGAFEEFFVLPEKNLHVLPDTLPTERAVFLEPLAAACQILDQCKISHGETVAVLGDGKLGLLIAMLLQVRGCRVHHYGRHPAKLSIAAALGVETRHAIPKGEYDWVVDATGSPEGLHQAVSMTAPTGVLILKSTVHGAVTIDTAPIIVNEITIQGSRCGRMEAALQWIHAIPVEALIADRFPLADAPRAFARAAERGVLKVLLAD